MESDRLRTDRIADECLQQRAARGDELAAELPEEFASPRIAAVAIGGGESLFRRRQDALEMEEQPVFDEMGMDASGAAAEKLDLESGHRVAGRSLDCSL